MKNVTINFGNRPSSGKSTQIFRRCLQQEQEQELKYQFIGTPRNTLL